MYRKFSPSFFVALAFLSLSSTLFAQLPLGAAKELRGLGKYDEALALCDSVIAITDPNESLLMANLYDLKGDIYYSNLYSDSLSGVQFFKSLEIKEKTPLPYEKPIDYTLFRLGLVHYYQAKLDTALHFHRRALKIREQVRDINLMRSYKALGTLFEDKEDFSRAEQYYQLALATLLEVDATDYRQLANLENYRGILFYKQAQYKSAVEVLNKALAYYGKIKQEDQSRLEVHIADCLTNLGNAYNEIGQHQQSLQAQQRAAKLYARSDQDVTSKIAWNLNNMAVTYNALGRTKETQQVLDQALTAHKRHLKSSRHSAYAAIHDNRGDIAMENADFREAAKQYELAVYNVLPLWQPENIDDIPEINKETLILGTKSNLLEYLSSRAAAYFLLFQEGTTKNHLMKSLLAYEASDEIITLLRRDISVEASKLFWVGKTKSIYEKAIEVCIELYVKTDDAAYLEKAFDFSEKSKSVILLEKLREDGALIFSDLPNKAIEKDRTLRASINKLEGALADTLLPEMVKQLQQLRMEHEVLIRQLEIDHPQYRRLKNAAQPADLRTVQQKTLSSETVLVEFFWGTNDLFVFSFNQDKIYFTSIKKTKELEQNIDAFLDLVAVPLDKTTEVERYAELAHLLYKELLAPTLREFKGVKRILLVPDGPLGHLPFEALIVEQAETPEFEFLHYVLEDYVLSYSYSASVMLQYRPNKEDAENFLLIAPEQYPNASTPDLLVPESLEKELKKGFGFSQLRGEEATKSHFFKKVPNYRVVHLYTHALAPENSPPFFNLRDSIVNIKELYNLDLAAELVVLSACETGKGDFKKGEGILSLSRGFSLAGVPSLISSRWKLRKNAAAKISSSFYKNLLEGYDKDEALRLSQLDFMKRENAAPYYWASFMQVGDYASIEFKRGSSPWKWVLLSPLVLGLALGFRRFR